MSRAPQEIAVSDPGTQEEGTFSSSHDNLTLYLTRYFPSSADTQAPIAHLIFVQ